MTPEEKARLEAELAKSEEQFGTDTLNSEPENDQQNWQSQKDKLVAQISQSNDVKEKFNLQQQLIKLERARIRSNEDLAHLKDSQALNENKATSISNYLNAIKITNIDVDPELN